MLSTPLPTILIEESQTSHLLSPLKTWVPIVTLLFELYPVRTISFGVILAVNSSRDGNSLLSLQFSRTIKLYCSSKARTILSSDVILTGIVLEMTLRVVLSNDKKYALRIVKILHAKKSIIEK